MDSDIIWERFETRHGQTSFRCALQPSHEQRHHVAVLWKHSWTVTISGARVSRLTLQNETLTWFGSASQQDIDNDIILQCCINSCWYCQISTPYAAVYNCGWSKDSDVVRQGVMFWTKSVWTTWEWLACKQWRFVSCRCIVALYSTTWNTRNIRLPLFRACGLQRMGRLKSNLSLGEASKCATLHGVGHGDVRNCISAIASARVYLRKAVCVKRCHLSIFAC